MSDMLSLPLVDICRRLEVVEPLPGTVVVGCGRSEVETPLPV